MIEILIRGNEVGAGISNDTGNAQITAIDRQANMLVSIEFTPEAWRQFLKQAPRIKGVGIPLAGRVPIINPENGSSF